MVCCQVCKIGSREYSYNIFIYSELVYSENDYLETAAIVMMGNAETGSCEMAVEGNVDGNAMNAKNKHGDNGNA